MRKIIYTQPDGTLAVVHPVRNIRGDEDLSDTQIEQRAFSRLPKNALNPQFVDASLVPADRTSRDAWRQDGNRIRVDAAAMAKLQGRKDLLSEIAELKARLAVLESK